ncbi:MAG: hypothetical protein ABIP51_16755 [Bacteroidia bacterium]
MSRKRTYSEFTEEQITIIKTNNGLITLKELAEKLNIHYTTLSGQLKHFRMTFTPHKKGSKQTFAVKSIMNKYVNEEGEELVTDELMKEWSYSNQVN